MSKGIWIKNEKLSEFERPTEEQHVAKIGGVWDVGFQKGYQDKPAKQKACIAFELDSRDSKGKRFVMFAQYTLSLFIEAPLRKLIDSLLGKDAVTEDAFNVERLIGADCLVTVGTTESGKSKVASVIALPKKMAGDKIAALEADYSKPFGLAKYLIDNQIKRPADALAEDEDGPSPDAPPF